MRSGGPPSGGSGGASVLAASPGLVGDADVRPPLAREVAGALGDLGTLVPLAVGIIVTCGLSTTVVVAGTGLMYLLVAAVYRLPVPVQPMKAVSAIALANELSPNVIAAAAVLLGVSFGVLGATGVLDRIAPYVPMWLVRAVQVAVGLALCKVAVNLLRSPPDVFDRQLATGPAVVVAVLVAAVCLWRPTMILAVLAVGVVAAVVLAPDVRMLGPSSIDLPAVGRGDFADAVGLLVIPQIPLTITSSCIATADATGAYYGRRARRVRPTMLATTIGVGNLAGGLIGTIPSCHGSGGVSAHHVFGARTWRAPVMVGSLLVVLGTVCGRGLLATISVFPVAVLAGLLGVVAVTHLRLLADMRRVHQMVAGVLGVAGFVVGVTEVIVTVAALLLVRAGWRRLVRS